MNAGKQVKVPGDKFSRYYRKHHDKCVADRRAYYAAHKDVILERAKIKRAYASRIKNVERSAEGNAKAWLKVWSEY